MNEQISAMYSTHPSVQTDSQIDKRSAYHQAGRAAAIYLGNKQKRLPAVHFQIIIKEQAVGKGKGINPLKAVNRKRIAGIEGGRLIQSLPVFKTESLQGLSEPELQEYRLAYEADIVNILAGPLAEAKYVALQDNKIFNPNSVYIGALKFYGGKADMETVNEYLACTLHNSAERDRKLAELFLAAYSFVNDCSNWQAISALANYIQEYSKDSLDCNEIIALLKSSRLAA